MTNDSTATYTLTAHLEGDFDAWCEGPALEGIVSLGSNGSRGEGWEERFVVTAESVGHARGRLIAALAEVEGVSLVEIDESALHR